MGSELLWLDGSALTPVYGYAADVHSAKIKAMHSAVPKHLTAAVDAFPEGSFERVLAVETVDAAASGPYDFTEVPATVPEPVTSVMMLLAMAALALSRKGSQR